MKLTAFKYNQNDQIFYSTIIKFEDLNKITKASVLTTDNPYGYQRSLNEKHYKAIASQIIKKSNELISPTSIIIGAYKNVFKEKVQITQISDSYDDLFDLNINEDYALFRTIDGQHRLKGLEMANISDGSLNNYKLNVIIMLIEDSQKYREVKVFNDINSKAKRIKLDLTILAKFNYDILEKNICDINLCNHITVNTIFKINEKKNSVWFNAIKVEVNEKNALGIIGFKSFYESLSKIVKEVLKSNKYEKFINNDNKLIKEDFLKKIDEISQDISSNYFNKFWTIIENKWPSCFKQQETEDSIHSTTEIYYSDDYYIQKVMGTKSINKIILECLTKNNCNLEKSITMFKEIIEASSLQNNHWKVKGIFSGLNSESGFKEITRYIKGEVTL